MMMTWKSEKETEGERKGMQRGLWTLLLPGSKGSTNPFLCGFICRIPMVHIPCGKISYVERENIKKNWFCLKERIIQDISRYLNIKYTGPKEEFLIMFIVMIVKLPIRIISWAVFLHILKKKNGSEIPLIILTSDHGEAMGEDDFYFAHGHSVGIDQVHVPLIIAGNGISRGIKIDAPVSNISIFKTVLDYMGMDEPPDKHGNSLLSFDSDNDNQPVFVESINQTGIIYNNIFFRKDRYLKDDEDFLLRKNINAVGIWRPLPEDEIRSLVPSEQEIKPDDVRYLKKELALYEEEASKAREIAESLRTDVQLTPDQIKQLRSLGYIE